MNQIQKNLYISTKIAIDETYDQLFLNHKELAEIKLGVAQSFLKFLKMVSCNHKTKEGSSTMVSYFQEYSVRFNDLVSVKEVQKKCHQCNQIFYYKKYILSRKKKK